MDAVYAGDPNWLRIRVINLDTMILGEVFRLSRQKYRKGRDHPLSDNELWTFVHSALLGAHGHELIRK